MGANGRGTPRQTVFRAKSAEAEAPAQPQPLPPPTKPPRKPSPFDVRDPISEMPQELRLFYYYAERICRQLVINVPQEGSRAAAVVLRSRPRTGGLVVERPFPVRNANKQFIRLEVSCTSGKKSDASWDESCSARLNLLYVQDEPLRVESVQLSQHGNATKRVEHLWIGSEMARVLALVSPDAYAMTGGLLTITSCCSELERAAAAQNA